MSDIGWPTGCSRIRWRPGRPNAEQGELAAHDRRPSDLDRAPECGDVLDHVIDRHDEKNCIGIGLGRDQARDGRGGGGVPPDWLENGGRAIDAQSAQLLGDEKPMVGIRDHDRTTEQWAARDPHRGLLQ